MAKDLVHQTSAKPNVILFFACFIAVIVVYHFCYGFETLNPGNITWLMAVLHDWGTHYLGWHFFKNEPWQFPIGNISNYYYPLGTNVGFTDSIPLLAIFFKLFARILPENFQYFGIWLLVCQMLSAYYTVKLLKLFRVKDIFIFISVIFVLVNPVMLYRTLHPALCAQWLLIGCIYLYFLGPSRKQPSTILIHQFTLLILAALINPYLCLMVFGFTLLLPVKFCFADKIVSKKYMILYVLGVSFSLILTWYIVGMVSFGKNEGLVVQGGFGLYGMNLNSLYNAAGFSTFLPAFNQVSWHQYEGFMYLGLGILLLLTLLLLYRIYRRWQKHSSNENAHLMSETAIKLTPLVILLVLFGLFAISNVVSFNEKVLFTIPVPKIITSLGDTFRASARFFWPLYYLILLFCLIGVSKIRIPSAARLVILLAASIIQLYDTKLLINQYNRDYQYKIPISNTNWESLIKEFDEIAFVPPFVTTNLLHMDYQYFCHMAAKARKPINTGYVARSDSKLAQAYVDSLKEQLAEGKLSETTLYITTDPHLYYFSTPLQTNSCSLNVLDNYYFLYSKQNKSGTVQYLSKKFNALNKLKLDSAMSQLPKQKFFSKTNAIDTSKKGIQHFMTTFKKTNKFLIVEGWAFIENTISNKGDSVLIVLSENDKFYVAPTIVHKRPDVTAHFNKPYLDDAGYSATIFTDSIEPGSYQLGLAIKTPQGEILYAATENIIEVNLSEFNSVQKVLTLPAVGDILWGLDYLTPEKDFIKISGWAAYKNQGSENCTTELVLKNGNDIFLADTYIRVRPDVTTHFNGKYKLDNSGFVARVKKSSIPKGKYQVGLLIKDAGRNKQAVIFIDQQIEI